MVFSENGTRQTNLRLLTWLWPFPIVVTFISDWKSGNCILGEDFEQLLKTKLSQIPMQFCRPLGQICRWTMSSSSGFFNILQNSHCLLWHLFFFSRHFLFCYWPPKTYLLQEKKLGVSLNKHLFPRKLNCKLVEKNGGLLTVFWIDHSVPRDSVV